MIKARIFLILGMWIVAACAPAQPEPVFSPFILVTLDPNATPTATPFQPEANLAAPTPRFLVPADTGVPPSPTATLSPSPIPPSATPQIAATSSGSLDGGAIVHNDGSNPALPPASSRTNYILYTTLDFPNRTVDVDETIRYHNTTGTQLSELVLSIQPNRYGNCLNISSIQQDGAELTSYDMDGQRLTINLPLSLQPDAVTTLTIRFTLNLPAKRANGLFGYDFNQVNLVDWYPFIVPYGQGWILHDPLTYGEHLVYDSADYEVNLKTDAGVIVAASAPGESNGDWTRYRLYGARTFALSASDEFLSAESAVGPVGIRSYFFEGYSGAGEGMRNAAVQAVGLFAAKFAPYPYESLSVVQADIHDGQEYDGLVFLSSDFYGQYGGSNRSNLITIGVHEIAHEWWFGLVGNDQAMEPWLDEALAVYSERVFYEFTSGGGNLDWWWQFRVDFFDPGGYVDTTIYQGGAFRPYTNAVYLNGAHFMEEFRNRMGDGDFYRFLENYAAQFSRRRATGQDFFAVARQNTNKDLSDLISRYFQYSY